MSTVKYQDPITGEWLYTGAPVEKQFTESVDHPGCFYNVVNGVQEWLNPPMKLGVEYKTTERYLGKPVYAKVVDFGALTAANTAKTVKHGIANIENVIFGAYTDNAGLLCTNYDNTVNFIIDRANIVIKCFSASTDYTAKVWMKYTKTTD